MKQQGVYESVKRLLEKVKALEKENARLRGRLIEEQCKWLIPNKSQNGTIPR